MSFHTTIARLREASYAAPAAGENPDTCRVGRQDLRTTLHLIDRLDADLQRAALASAPVSGEAVRIPFPAHLRKMWSGGEVQAWLDEYQGLPSAQPSAKGSLERYRQWQTEQAQADKDGGDCAEGAAKLLHGLVEEAINWLETGGGRADSLCADLRKALAAQKQDSPQKYWLCCGSTEPEHRNRRAPDCFKPSRAQWGTADQHSATQKPPRTHGGGDA